MHEKGRDNSMGLFGFGKKKAPELPPVNIADDQICALADGEMIDLGTVPDPVFAQKMMGDGVAFKYAGNEVTVCAPANGKLTALFPTGHAFGITRSDGVELLVHIGIDTVNAKGDGFKLLGHKQDDTVKAGEPIVTVDLKKLGAKYDMSVMLIVTNANEKDIKFTAPGKVTRGQVISL